MTRWFVLAFALMIGAAAPARAWCEATCLAPAAGTQSHCPTHDPGNGTTTLTASTVDRCPVLESARPNAPARLDVLVPIAGHSLPALNPPTHAGLSAERPHQPATVFERCTPLRI